MRSVTGYHFSLPEGVVFIYLYDDPGNSRYLRPCGMPDSEKYGQKYVFARLKKGRICICTLHAVGVFLARLVEDEEMQPLGVLREIGE